MDTVRSVRRDLGEGVRGIRAFTLIELLVVVSIIALLISILLPALKGARESARRSVCLSNQRQQGVAASIYYDDNNGAFPTKYMVNANGPYGFDSWFSIRALSKSVKGSDVEISDIFVCPNAPFDQYEPVWLHSYGFNSGWGGWSRKVDGYYGVGIDYVKRPSAKVFSLDMPGPSIGSLVFNQSVVWHPYDFVPGAGANGVELNTTFSPTIFAKFWTDFETGRHQESCNVLFMDSHAENMSSAEVTQQYHFAGASQALVENNMFNIHLP